jgi:hypothetical protein
LTRRQNKPNKAGLDKKLVMPKIMLAKNFKTQSSMPDRKQKKQKIMLEKKPKESKRQAKL